jgi:hypothetical protein
VLEVVVFEDHIRLMVTEHLHRTSAQARQGRSGIRGWGRVTDLEASMSSSSAAEEEADGDGEVWSLFREWEWELVTEADLVLCLLALVKMYFWLQCVQVTR